MPRVERPQKHWNAISLALLGDAVWELYLRRFYLFPPEGPQRMRERIKRMANAEYQVCPLLAAGRPPVAV